MSQFDPKLPQSPGGLNSSLPRISPPPRPADAAEPEDSSIGLIGEDDASASEHKIRAIVGSDSVRRQKFTRNPSANGSGACRVRSFRGRLSDQGLEYMDNQINEWLDAHPEIEIKFATSTVGVFEGKMREPAMILTLWY